MHMLASNLFCLCWHHCHPDAGTSTAAIGGGVAAALVVVILIIIVIVVLILVVSKSRTEKPYQENQGKF